MSNEDQEQLREALRLVQCVMEKNQCSDFYSGVIDGELGVVVTVLTNYTGR